MVKPSDQVAYMLYGDGGEAVGGPFLGDSGLDLPSLASEFRTNWYAVHEARSEDWCFIDDSDFIEWLVECKILHPMETVSLDVHIDTCGDHAYTPKHWPLCPHCKEGRGREEAGPVLRSLNRQEWYRQCASCGHQWGHHDEEWSASLGPMLEDDGRCVAGGCVPYSISKACGVPFADALNACRARGWREDKGLTQDHGFDVIGMFDHEVIPVYDAMITGKFTLKKALAGLSQQKKYIVSTRRHWLAVVHGDNLDQADTRFQTEVVGCWEVRPAKQD